MRWGSRRGQQILDFIVGKRNENLTWDECADLVRDQFKIRIKSESVRKQIAKYRKGEPEDHKPADSMAQTEVAEPNTVVDEIDKNSRVVTINSEEIKTLSDLIRECMIDTEEWLINKHIINYWGNPGYRNFQVKAWLDKRKPDEVVFPDIKSVSFSTQSKSYKPPKRMNGMKKCVVIPDTQVGFLRDMYSGKMETFHDRIAMDVVLQIIAYSRPEMVVLLGDMIDLPEWSTKFIRAPEMYWTTQPALIELSWFIAQIRALVPDAWIYYIEGNHESRIPKNIMTNLIAAYNISRPDNAGMPVLSISNLLGLDAMDVNYVGDYPNGKVWINKDLACTHGDKAKANSGDTVRELLKANQVSMIVGHAHRFEYISRTFYTMDGHKKCRGFSPGTLARIGGSLPANKRETNQQQGCGVIDYNDEVSNIIPVEIDNGIGIYDGRVFCGEDYTERLKKDTQWQF